MPGGVFWEIIPAVANMTPFSRNNPPGAVLVVRLGAIGDIVRTLPAVRLIRRTWPAARIGWAVEGAGATLLRGQPDVDELIVLERGALVREVQRFRPGALARTRDFAAALRAFGADLALDFQSSFKSGLTAWLSRAAVRTGFDRGFDREGSHLFATQRVTLPEARIHRVDRAIALARAAGVDDGPHVADLGLSPEERAAGRARVAALAGPRRRIALAPFSSARQPWKRYPAERWAEVAQGLAAAGHAVVIVHGPAEDSDARRLADTAGAGVIPCGAPPLRELAAMIAACDLFVGGDTGPMHVAWSCGVPVVAVYGPTDPVLNAPFGTGHRVLAPPRPSRRHDPDPFPGITVELILSTALDLITPRPRRSENRP